MNTNIRGRIATVAFAGAVALFGLTACGGTDAPTEKPSSSQSQEESKDLRGNDLQVYTNDGNNVSWHVYAPGGTAEGTVDIKVGDQTFADQETIGKIVPDIAPGDYTVHVTYTNKDGEVLEEDSQYSFTQEKVELKFVTENNKIVAGEPFSLPMEVVGGTPSASGTVTVSDMDTGEELFSTEVVDAKFTLDFPAPESPGSIPVTIEYSGDVSNDGTIIDRQFTAEEG